jgi:hypothetical protein
MFAEFVRRAHCADASFSKQLRFFVFSSFHICEYCPDVVAIRSTRKLGTIHYAMESELGRHVFTTTKGVAVDPKNRELIMLIFCGACLLAARNE